MISVLPVLVFWSYRHSNYLQPAVELKVAAAQIWNSTQPGDITSSRNQLKTHLFRWSYPDICFIAWYFICATHSGFELALLLRPFKNILIDGLIHHQLTAILMPTRLMDWFTISSRLYWCQRSALNAGLQLQWLRKVTKVFLICRTGNWLGLRWLVPLLV